MRLSLQSSFRQCAWLLLASVPLLALAGAARAADGASSAANPVPSLDIVPDDAAFYSVMLRNREQWQAMTNSKAWNKLKEMPLVQMGLGLWAIQAADQESVPGKIQSVMRQPELRKPIDLLADMMSDEVFVYGGHGVIEMMQLMQQINKAQQFAPLTAAMNKAQSGEEATDPSQAQAKAILNLLASQADKVQVPETVWGFHVKDTKLAQEMLDKLEEKATAALDDQPLMKDRLKKTTVDGHAYLTLSLDGGMIPWEELKLDQIREKSGSPENFDKLIEHVKSMKLVLSLGLHDDYIIAAMGPDTDVLTHIGHGNSLHSRKEFAPLARHAKKPLLSVGYVSEIFQRATAMNKEDIAQLPDAVKSYLPALKVPAAMRHDIMRDVTSLAHDMKALVPEVGAVLAFSYRVDGGQEGFVYDWTQHAEMDASKPLTLLKHIGGSPIAAIVTRGKYELAPYDALVKWTGVAYGYFEKYGLPKMSEAEQAQFKEVYGKMLPLVKRANEVTREKLLPSLSDGQIGLVIDGKLKSKQFVAALPETPKEMPMIEPAIVLGVADAAMLRKAIEEYYEIGDQFVDVIRSIKDSKVPEDFKLLRPTESTASGGSVFSFKLPEAWGVDEQVLPNAALSEHVAVLTLSQKHSERLLAEATPEMAGRQIPVKTPLGTASGFDFAALIDAATPWIDYGIDIGMKDSKGGPFDAEAVRDQVHTVLDVLKVFRGGVSVSYFEDKALVSRWHSEIHDVTE